MFTRESSIQLSTRKEFGIFARRAMVDQHQACVNTGMCEHRFCSQTETRGDRNCTAYFSLANIFNQSTNKSFGAKLQSEVTGGFTQVRIGNLINQSATICAISIPPLLEDCSEQKLSKDLMLLTIEAVLHIRTKLLGSMWSRNRFLMQQS